jgi:hypothetical protein
MARMAQRERTRRDVDDQLTAPDVSYKPIKEI